MCSALPHTKTEDIKNDSSRSLQVKKHQFPTQGAGRLGWRDVCLYGGRSNLGLLRVGETLGLVWDHQKSMSPKAEKQGLQRPAAEDRWKPIMAAWGWRREAGQEDKVRDVQGKQRSRGGLSNGAVRIPYSRRGLDTDSVGDPGQAIPTVSLPLFLKGRHRVRHTSRSGMAHSLASFKPSPWAQPDLLTYNCNPPQCSQSAPHPPHPALPLSF